MSTLEKRRLHAEAVIKAEWGTSAAFSEASGISETRISRALDAGQVTDRRLAPIEAAIGRLLKGNGVREERSLELSDEPARDHEVLSKRRRANGEGTPSRRRELVYVPLMALAANGGNGREPLAPVVQDFMAYDPYQLRQDVGVNLDKLMLIPITGNSMEPTLRPGDRVLVVKYDGEPLVDGAIYVWHREYQGIIVKRAYWQKDGGLLLRSDNREEGVDFEIRPGEEHEWNCVGRVVRVERSV